jgi:transposase-like protein
MSSTSFNGRRVHFARNALAQAGRSGRRAVSAFTATAFAQETAETAKAQWRKVVDQLRPTIPKLAPLMDSAEDAGDRLHALLAAASREVAHDESARAPARR